MNPQTLSFISGKQALGIAAKPLEGRGQVLRGAAILAAAGLIPHSVWACAACYGQSDSPMAAGMNWGILSLLGMIVFVLGGVAAFFIVLARRSAALSKSSTGPAAVSPFGASASISTDTADELPAQALAGRGSYKRFSGLAEQRKRCGHPRSESGRAGVPRSRRGSN